MIISLFLVVMALLQPAIEITDIQDRPNDAGDGLHIYVAMPENTDDLLSLVIYRKETSQPDSCWCPVLLELVPDIGEFLVDGYDPDYIIEPEVEYMFMPATVTASGDTLMGEVFVSPVVSRSEYFNTDEFSVFIASILFILMIFYYFGKAQRGQQMYLRPIAGIEAIDEAIGRATEMGKPILYVPGLSTISDVATIASLTILGRVAKKVAEYQTTLMVPNCDPIVYTVATESVKQAYLEAGRPDAYDEDSVFFLTTSQFAFVAGVNGIMMREKPATNFYLGMFWAESLLLAETGSLSGAIQIAGTDAVTQLPFFITTCDYTLIGEELYAASAYLGREPKQIGALKGQDACKAIVMILLTLGVILSTVSIITGNDSFMFLREMLLSGGAG
ncbi:hypothetical protein DRQ25_10165 [Candidatus Fermentibacteria bacterium]|nr:MAG: hypothetical protein DRQ25_10165 [Candidatus Fermentibacteria bacterium]